MATLQERNEVVQRLLCALQEDARLTGAVLVGSGAIGFLDEESDIDLVAVVDPGHGVTAVFEDWSLTVPKILPVLYRSETPFSLSNRLHCFLLEGLLEVDLSFVSISDLRATGDRWRVLFDRTGSVRERMSASDLSATADLKVHRWIFDAACYRVLQCRKALRRGHVWKAAITLFTRLSRKRCSSCAKATLRLWRSHGPFSKWIPIASGQGM